MLQINERIENIETVINNYNVTRKEFINDKDKTKYVNKVIDKIYCINLKDNKIRRNYIIKLMEKYNINFELIMVPCLDIVEYNLINNKNISLGEAGCYISHMFCLLDAINNNYNRVIIFEDDIILYKKFHEEIEKIHNLNDIDLLMLGCSDYHFKTLNRNLVKDNLYSPNKKTTILKSTHAILYSNKMVKNVYYSRLNKPTYFDDNLMQFFYYGNSYIYSPNLAIVEFSTSSLQHNNNFFKRENSYYNDCHYNLDFRNYNFIYLFLFNSIKNNININLINNNKLLIQKIFNESNIQTKYINKILSKIEYNFFDSDFIEFVLIFELS